MLQTSPLITVHMKRLLSLVFFFLFSLIFVFTPKIECASPCKKYYEQAEKMIKQREYEKADQFFSFAIAGCPIVTEYHFERAKLRQNYLRNYSDAIVDYTNVIKLNKKGYLPKTYYMRGRCWNKLGNYFMAVKDFSKCLQLEPRYGGGGRAYISRAEALAKLGMKEAALKDLATAVKNEPKWEKTARKMSEAIIKGKY